MGETETGDGERRSGAAPPPARDGRRGGAGRGLPEVPAQVRARLPAWVPVARRRPFVPAPRPPPCPPRS